MSLLLESILVVTGLPPKRLISGATVESAQKLGKQFNEKIVSFVNGVQGPFLWEPAPTTDELRAKLAEQIDPEKLAKNTERLGDDPTIVVEIAATLANAQQYLLSIWPVITIDVTGAPLVPLSRDDLDAIWSVTRVLMDPKLIVDEIASWTVTEAQAKAFAQIFPEMYKEIDRMIERAAIERISEGKSIAPEVEDVIRTWKMKPLDTPIKIEDAPKNQEQPAQPAQAGQIDPTEIKAPSEMNIGERTK